jgi:uncharacterized membrane protein
VSRLVALVRGFPGHPSHPPLTDVSIGAYTVATAMFILGALDIQRTQMAHGALLALSGGLIVAVPTVLTGFVDWLDMAKSTPSRRLATRHLFVMLTATVLFAITWLLQRPGYIHGTVKTTAWIVAIVAELSLAIGGYLGGTTVFVYGQRVTQERDRPSNIKDALTPTLATKDHAPIDASRLR